MLHILMHQQNNAFASFSPALAVVRYPLQWEKKLFPLGSQDWRVFWFTNFFLAICYHFKQTAHHSTMHDLHGHESVMLSFCIL